MLSWRDMARSRSEPAFGSDDEEVRAKAFLYTTLCKKFTSKQ